MRETLALEMPISAARPARHAPFKFFGGQSHLILDATSGETAGLASSEGQAAFFIIARSPHNLMYSSTLVTCWTGRSAGFSRRLRRRARVPGGTQEAKSLMIAWNDWVSHFSQVSLQVYFLFAKPVKGCEAEKRPLSSQRVPAAVAIQASNPSVFGWVLALRA